MSIDAISTLGASQASATTKTKTDAKSTGDMFMTLLVAQLKNQDPLNPQDGTEFLGQLTQINSLEQLTGINQSINKLISYAQQQQGTSQKVSA